MLQGNISRVEDSTRCIEPCEACGKDVVNGGGYAFEQCGCPEGKAMEKAMMDEWTLPARVRIAQEDDARQASLDRVAAFNAGYEAARADICPLEHRRTPLWTLGSAR